MPLPVILHMDFGADCCGCLAEVVGEATEYRCNEFNALVPPKDMQRVILEMESCEET
jgi:hypothetical protein